MTCNLENPNQTLLEFEQLVREGGVASWSGELKVGVDLGTANIVVAVVDENDRPVAGMSVPSHVVRDGIVVDYVHAVSTVSKMKAALEEKLGVTLTKAATAIPPGIISGNVRCIANVVEGAGFQVTKVIDEPSAAAAVLGISSGAVVDVGGGTTGISILEKGEVLYTADEATGGTHMTLVLAGYYRKSTEEAEGMKKDPSRESEVFPVVRPVVEKMASIVRKYIANYSVDAIYVVGGACCFSEFESIFEKEIGIHTVKPAVPLLVTPLGIAISA
ncbi:MAG: ethanolamine utilization protein EutJ [Hespellia sp.]|nr:ethanolamine utilization protein EutJ [Hespellia sp.]